MNKQSNYVLYHYVGGKVLFPLRPTPVGGYNRGGGVVNTYLHTLLKT